MRVKKQTPSGTEYYIRDHTGRELAVLGTNNRVKYLNLFGNGLIGRIDVRWDSTFVKDPGIENKSFGSMSENITENSSGGYWVYNRIDERSYYGKDHLGNIRLVIDESNQVLSAQDYYPYGEILRVFNTGGYSAKYLFTEKERDIETNYDYFGARYYDSELGRWLSVDPLADKYPGLSPYNYTLNNPLKYVDPDGREVKSEDQEHLQKTADRLNEFFKGANISVISVEGEEGMFALATDIESGFDWSQNEITSALFDVIHSPDVSFNVNFADKYNGDAYVYKGAEMGVGGFGGGKLDHRAGGGTIWIAKEENKINSKNYGIVFMHEAIGHGHPAGGNDARKIEKRFLGYEKGSAHGGYRSNIGWSNTGLFSKMKRMGF
jgi:RHS repeat-associated protein